MSGARLKLYLIRHPATSVDKRRPPEDWQLSEEGERQLDALLRCSFWSEVQHVYSSAEPKAAAVAERVHSDLGIPLSLHSELRELKRVGFAHDYAQQVARVLASPGEEIGGWESLESALGRVWAFLTEVAGRGVLPAAVVSHGIVLSAVRARLLGRPLVSPAEWRALPFGGVAQIDAVNWQLTADFVAPQARRV